MAVRGHRGQRSDVARNELVRVGATVTALSEMFSRDDKSVRQAIARNSVQAIVTEDGRELYPIRKIAPFLVDMSTVVDLEQVIKSTNLKKLPPELTKNFWEAANARKKHLQENGELWRTEAVMEVFVDVFKTLRESVNLFVDTVSDRTETTEKQRQLVVEMCDGLLASMRVALIDTFELYSPLAEERDTHDDDDGTK